MNSGLMYPDTALGYVRNSLKATFLPTVIGRKDF